jgi:hypothetical protein
VSFPAAYVVLTSLRWFRVQVCWFLWFVFDNLFLYNFFLRSFIRGRGFWCRLCWLRCWDRGSYWSSLWFEDSWMDKISNITITKVSTHGTGADGNLVLYESDNAMMSHIRERMSVAEIVISRFNNTGNTANNPRPKNSVRNPATNPPEMSPARIPTMNTMMKIVQTPPSKNDIHPKFMSVMYKIIPIIVANRTFFHCIRSTSKPTRI